MSGFDYRDGTLWVEDLTIVDIATEIGTPFYAYSRAVIATQYHRLDTALARAMPNVNTQICYAVKANPHLSIIAALAECGAGADIVSQGELLRVQAVGVEPTKIAFSGVGKTADEIDCALAAKIGLFNVESIAELDLLVARAKAQNTVAPLALRLNPDIDAATHDKITTGRAGSKFGIAWADAAEVIGYAATLEHVELIGLDIHIGSQITTLEPFRASFAKLATLVTAVRAQGHKIRVLDIGGGIGVAYKPAQAFALDAYAKMIAETLGMTGCTIMLEPGRFLVAEAGILVTSVIRKKLGVTKNFIIVDAAMNDLMRPALYNSWHEIRPVVLTDVSGDISDLSYDIVGPVCESSDYLGKDRILPSVRTGDLLAIFMAGAYGSSLGHNYNTRLRPAEIMISGSQMRCIRRRETYDDLLRLETRIDWSGT